MTETLLWQQPDWLREAQSWIRTALQRRRITPTGEIEQFHVYPWATVMRLPTAEGLVYFKASMKALAVEPTLTEYLARLHPGLVPDLLAVDLPRGWMLMRDSGVPLRTFIKAEKSLERWRDILPLYVGLQKDMLPRVGEILALGVPDRRLETLPEQFERLVAEEGAMLIGQPDGLSPDEYRCLRSMGPEFARQCRELASFNIPPTLHHDDFHDGNLFIQDGQVRFTDWAENAVTHPFFTLIVLLRGAENSLDLPPEAPELAQVRDWYLSHWTDYASLADLQDAVRLAQRIGLVNRALTWRRVLSNLPEEYQSQFALAVPAYLQDFLNEVG